MTRVLNVNRREARRDLSELANMRRKLESTTQEVAVKADIAKRVMRENNELRYECAILRPLFSIQLLYQYKVPKTFGLLNNPKMLY